MSVSEKNDYFCFLEVYISKFLDLKIWFQTIASYAEQLLTINYNRRYYMKYANIDNKPCKKQYVIKF